MWFGTGEVAVGVHPALPVESIDMILANDQAGNRVWADVPPPYITTQVPVLPPLQTEVVQSAEVLPEVELFPVGAVTQAMGQGKDEAANQ